jgi:hypothetical protein
VKFLSAVVLSNKVEQNMAEWGRFSLDLLQLCAEHNSHMGHWENGGRNQVDNSTQFWNQLNLQLSIAQS